jgi:predicted anti-sigma-YlaC factor YlaD
MDCYRVKKILVPFLEGGLSEKLKVNVEAHLKVCVNCQKERELLSKSWQMLDSYVAPKLKDDFTPSLMRRIHSEQTKIIKVAYRLPQFSFRRLAPVLATILVTVLIFSWFWKEQIGKEKLAKVTPPVSQEAVTKMEAVTAMADEEIINNLDLYENIELLENIELSSEFDIVEDWEGATS